MDKRKHILKTTLYFPTVGWLFYLPSVWCCPLLIRVLAFSSRTNGEQTDFLISNWFLVLEISLFPITSDNEYFPSPTPRLLLLLLLKQCIPHHQENTQQIMKMNIKHTYILNLCKTTLIRVVTGNDERPFCSGPEFFTGRQNLC